MKALVCSGGGNAAYVLRGLLSQNFSPGLSRLDATGTEAPTLVDFIMSKDCPVSASLTDDDKRHLLHIKQNASEKPGG